MYAHSPCYNPTSLISPSHQVSPPYKSLIHICFWLRPAGFNRICCVSTGFELPIGSWLAYPCTHFWRKWLLLHQNPRGTNSSAEKGRVPWITSNPPMFDGWQIQSCAGPVQAATVAMGSWLQCLHHTQETASHSSPCPPVLIFFLLPSSTVIPEPQGQWWYKWLVWDWTLSHDLFLAPQAATYLYIHGLQREAVTKARSCVHLWV